MNDVDDFLSHYGVKGMKWGVRRSGGSSSGKKVTSSRARAKRMSDDELKTAVARLELEKKYIDLNAHTSAAGKKYAKNLLDQAGKVAVGAAVGAVVGAAVKAKLNPKKD